MSTDDPTVPGGAVPPRGSDRYTLESLIATGGMGEVWRAHDTVLSREVALKLLKNEYAGDPTFRSRFETEARNAAQLHHPNVASVFDFGELPAGPGGARRSFLVMELVRGEPLSALLRSGEPMPATTAADLVAQAADGLAAAHALGIVHRDVKPANLLVTPERTVKITDFGIARAADAVALTQTGQVIGTPQYLSPEQAEGRPVTVASDVYSLGVVLFECLAGKRPFDGESPVAIALAHLREEPPQLGDDVPAALRAVVATALSKDPRARFASMRDMAAALRGQPGTAPLRAAAPVPVPVPVPVPDDATSVLPAAARQRDADWDAQGPRTPVPPPRDLRGRDDDRRGGAAWLPWLLLAAVLVAAVVLLVHLAGSAGSDDPGGSASPTPEKSSAPARSPSRTPASASASQTPQVTLDEDDYVGKPRATAAAQITALGLEVRQREVDNPGSETAGTVAGVDPSGTLDKGSVVTLSYYADAAPTTSAAPTPSPSATPTATPTTPAPTPPGQTKKPGTEKPQKTKKPKDEKGDDG